MLNGSHNTISQPADILKMHCSDGRSHRNGVEAPRYRLLYFLMLGRLRLPLPLPVTNGTGEALYHWQWHCAS